jgi:hypothetical protein
MNTTLEEKIKGRRKQQDIPTKTYKTTNYSRNLSNI